MSTPIAADLLNRLNDAGISTANIVEELMWLNHLKIDIKRDREAYTHHLSRIGRNFVTSRRTRILLCDYLERVQDVVVTNVEVRNPVDIEKFAEQSAD